MKKFLLGFTSLLIIFSFSYTVNGTSLGKTVKTLIEEGSGGRQGKDSNYGAFFVTAASVEKPTKKENKQKAYQKASTLAKKKLAEFMGEKISSRESLKRWEKVVRKNGKSSIETGKQLESTTKSVVKQLLKGARLETIKEKKNKVVAVYVVTTDSISIANKLKKNILKGEAEKTNKTEQPKDATVIAIGFGAIVNGKVGKAKKQAKLSAQKDAVSQVLGTIMAASTQMQNYNKIKSKVFSNSSGFIKHYNILNEGRRKDSYKLKMRATVSSKKIYDSYKSFLQSMGNPPFYIEANEDEELKSKFSSFFDSKGLNITRRLENAAYVIKLKGKFDRIKHPIQQNTGTQLSLWVKLYDPINNKLLFTIKNDPKEAAVFYGNKRRQHNLTIKKAFQQIRKPLHKNLNETIVSLAREGRTVKIVFDKYSKTYNDKLQKIQTIVNRIPGVSNSNYSVNAIQKQLVFKVKYAGKIEALQDFLTSEIKKEISSMQPSLEKSSTNKLVFSL